MDDKYIHELTSDELYAYVGILIMLGALKKKDVEIGGSLAGRWQSCSPSGCDMCYDVKEKIPVPFKIYNIWRCPDQTRISRIRWEVFQVQRSTRQSTFEVPNCIRTGSTHEHRRGTVSIPRTVCCKAVYFEVYLGKETDAISKNLGVKVVMTLTKPMHGTARNVTIDNFFTSKALAVKLWDLGLTMVGTIRSNRRELIPDFMPNRKRDVFSSPFFPIT